MWKVWSWLIHQAEYFSCCQRTVFKLCCSFLAALRQTQWLDWEVTWLVALLSRWPGTALAPPLSLSPADPAVSWQPAGRSPWPDAPSPAPVSPPLSPRWRAAAAGGSAPAPPSWWTPPLTTCTTHTHTHAGEGGCRAVLLISSWSGTCFTFKLNRVGCVFIKWSNWPKLVVNNCDSTIVSRQQGVLWSRN